MVRRSTALIITAISLMLICLCLTLPQTSGASSSLTVEVVNQYTNAPISGATVTITGPVSSTATTGVNGKVTFSNIPSGNYSLIASAPDYPTSAPHIVEVSGKTTTIVHFSFTKAHFTFTPSYPIINSTVAFNANQSTSSGPITDYSWDFGDGTNGTGIAPTHVFTRPDSYEVTLTVTSTVGTASYWQIIQVVDVNENPFFPWILVLLIPFLIPLFFFLRRRRYYVVIQARVPVHQRHPLCPGDDTRCEDCKMTPC